MNKEALAAIAIFILVLGLVSRRLEKSIVTPPMAYVLFGLLISSSALGLIQEIEITNELIKVLAEITLALLLFTDASRIKFDRLRQEYNLPLRLLGIGLPITVVLGTVFAVVLFRDLNIWSAAVLSTILAPTDAALGQAIVNSSRIPASIRQAINVESGLNDGICLPILLLFFSLAEESKGSGAAYWLEFASQQVVFGILIGIAVGYFGIKLIDRSLKWEWITDSFEDLAVLGLSILAYTCTEIAGGNGFIAAFVAGLTVGVVARESTLKHLQEFAEAEGQLLTLISFLLFGAVMVIPSIASSTWQMWLYAIGSLTLVRLISVAIALSGLKLQLDSILIIGWFGPRGIASIIYGLLMTEKESLAGSELIFTTMVVTVFVSIFAHGITAYPSSLWYANRIADKKDIHYQMPEMIPVPELPVRLPWS